MRFILLAVAALYIYIHSLSSTAYCRDKTMRTFLFMHRNDNIYFIMSRIESSLVVAAYHKRARRYSHEHLDHPLKIHRYIYIYICILIHSRIIIVLKSVLLRHQRLRCKLKCIYVHDRRTYSFIIYIYI